MFNSCNIVMKAPPTPLVPYKQYTGLC